MKSALGSVIGWIIVALVVIVAFRFVIGTFWWVLRTLSFLILLAVLVTAYLALKSPPDDKV